MSNSQNCYNQYTQVLAEYDPLKQPLINLRIKLENYYNGTSTKTPAICIQEYKDDIKAIVTPSANYDYINDQKINNAIINYITCVKSFYPTTPPIILPKPVSPKFPWWGWLILVLIIFVFIGIFGKFLFGSERMKTSTFSIGEQQASVQKFEWLANNTGSTVAKKI